jgi:hypothetical protein
MGLNVNPGAQFKEAPVPLDDPDRFFSTLDPVVFSYSTCPCGKPHMSLVPSATANTTPDPSGYLSLSGPDGIRIVRKDDEYMRVSEQELITVLWAKVRQLSARVEALEGGAA